ncbi:hypothetical protein DOTSEDRAFT_139742 [Dothistroma septosporum NZE10]|uniref:Uncharacterized protein n=1 Tax=Dothistroma septosporum (strain NZE10 / CBS 128990) TaxID=675120 RepID=M2YIM6_DOTSN|nr:hypothetical protein DOTSEDRAFT_139742 [Dothistroma septosporum NZE10]
MWYNGLWDPPLALRPASSEVVPTAPGGGGGEVQATTTVHAVPSSQPQSPTVPATAASIVAPTTPVAESSGPHKGLPEATPKPKPTGYVPANEPWHQNVNIGGKNYAATAANGVCRVAGVTLTVGAPAQTLPDGVVCSYGQNGLVVQGSKTIHFNDNADQAQSGSQPLTTIGAQNGDFDAQNGHSGNNEGNEDAAVITINDHAVTAVQTQEGGLIIIGSSITLTLGGAATTISGQVVSAATNGVVLGDVSTVGLNEGSATTGSQGGMPSNTAGSGNDNDDSHTSISSNSLSGSGTNSTTATATGNLPVATGFASSMSPAQALSLFTALLAVIAVG